MHSQEIASYLAMTLGEKREAKAQKKPVCKCKRALIFLSG
jgi:hypothetical protein